MRSTCFSSSTRSSLACITGRHVADFIQKQRAVVGLLELAQVPRDGAGEGAFLVAEELGFDQFGGHGGAVQRDEGAVAARAAIMQRARDQFLAGAGLAQNADARFAGGHPIHLRHHAPHGLAGVNDLVFADALPQLPVLVFEAPHAQDVVDGEQQLFGGERLFQKIDGAEPRGAHGHFDVGLAGDHDHRHRRALRFQDLRAARGRLCRA